MSETGFPDLEYLERRAYETIWDDGLIDIFAGLALVSIGIMWVSQFSVYGAFVAPILVPLWVAARKSISEPRIGIVRFAAERVAVENKKLLGLFMLGVLTFVIGVLWFVFGQPESTFRSFADLNVVAGLPAALLAIPAVVIAIAYGKKRFLGYALVLLCSALPVIIYDLHPGWAFIPGGVLCAAIGSHLLYRFVRKYPIDE